MVAGGGPAATGVFVTAEDAERSKPAPDGFLLGAKRLGVAPEDCLAFEDAPAGIAAAERRA